MTRRDIADRAAHWLVVAALALCALIVLTGVPVCAWRLVTGLTD